MMHKAIKFESQFQMLALSMDFKILSFPFDKSNKSRHILLFMYNWMDHQYSIIHWINNLY